MLTMWVPQSLSVITVCSEVNPCYISFDYCVISLVPRTLFEDGQVDEVATVSDTSTLP